MENGPTRRDALIALLAAGCGAHGPARAERVDLLPPTADASTFFSQCIRCFRCGEVCTAGCIAFHPPWASPKLAGTPYIDARETGCNTCMACTSACPTGALTAVDGEDVPAVLEAVDMGEAFVDTGICLSHLGRVCGVCHDACPFPSVAIKLGSWARPEVLDACVGCGRCEERCPQVPTAIRVYSSAPGPRWTKGV